MNENHFIYSLMNLNSLKVLSTFALPLSDFNIHICKICMIEIRIMNRKSEKKKCAGCLRDGEHRNAELWCEDCKEMVCNTCGKFHKKLSPPHSIIQWYEKLESVPELLKVSSTCSTHEGRRISLYCNDHDVLICELCTSFKHKSCKQIQPIGKAAENVKNVPSLKDAQKEMESICLVREKIVKDDLNYDSKDAKVKLRKEIGECKEKIIAHLNSLEESLFKNLDDVFESNPTLSIDKVHITSIKDTLEKWKNDIATLKDVSKVDQFQIVKFLYEKIRKEEKINDDLLKCINRPSVKFEPSNFVLDLKLSFPSLGRLEVFNESVPESPLLEIEQPCKFFVTYKKSASPGKLQLLSSFETCILGKEVKIYRGCFWMKRKLILKELNGHNLFICNVDGSENSKIELDYNPSRICMYDKNQALVTSEQDFIQVVNISKQIAGRKIKVGKETTSICSRNEIIWVKVGSNRLVCMDFDGKTLAKLKTSFDPFEICAHESGVLYCTAINDVTIYAITQNGQEHVILEDVLDYPRGLTLDEDNNLYIADFGANEIHKLSADGEDHSIVLTQSDGIKQPTGMFFNRYSNELLIINNEFKTVCIYKVP